MARVWVDAHRDPVAVVIAQDGQVLRSYRSHDFPWLDIRNSGPLPSGSIADEHNDAPGNYSEMEEIEPDIWFAPSDASRVLMLIDQVLWQQNGYAMILLHIELDED